MSPARRSLVRAPRAVGAMGAMGALGAMAGPARSALSAIPELSLWTAIWAQAPLWVPRLGRSLVGQPTGPAALVALVGLIAAALAGRVLAAGAGGVGSPGSAGRTSPPQRQAVVMAVGGAVVALASLVVYGPLAAVAAGFAFWRGVAAAEYGRWPSGLRSAMVWSGSGYALAALVFARAGLSVDTLLGGLFVTVVGGLLAIGLSSGNTVDVGARTYRLPARTWQRRVALATIVAAVGIPALIIVFWAAWTGPANLGLAAVAGALRTAVGWLWGLFVRAVILILTPIALVLNPLVRWLRGLARPRPPAGEDVQILPGQTDPSDWLKQLDTAVRAPHIPAWVVGTVVIAVAALLIYLSLRRSGSHQAQSLADRVEDLRPEGARPRRSSRRFARRAGLEPVSPVRAAYRAFLTTLAAAGRSRPAKATPREFAAGLPACDPAIDTLTEAYMTARYGRPGGLPEADERAALAAWRDLRGRLGTLFPRQPAPRQSSGAKRHRA